MRWSAACWSERKLTEQQLDELNDKFKRVYAADASCTRIARYVASCQSLLR